MGKGFVYRCPKCDHEEEWLTGVGFMSPLEADMERESILAGIYGPKAQAALVAHPEAPVSVERAMYQCGAVGGFLFLLYRKLFIEFFLICLDHFIFWTSIFHSIYQSWK